MFIAAECVREFLEREIRARYPGCTVRQVPPRTELAEIQVGQKKAGPWPWSRKVPDVVYVPVEHAETAALELEDNGKAVGKITYDLYLGHDPHRHVVAWWFEVLSTEMYESEA